MKIDEARAIIPKLEEILKVEEKLTGMYFDMTIIASQVGAERTYQDMNDIGETVGAHQEKTKQLIARFKAAETRIKHEMEKPKAPETGKFERKLYRVEMGFPGAQIRGPAGRRYR